MVRTWPSGQPNHSWCLRPHWVTSPKDLEPMGSCIVTSSSEETRGALTPTPGGTLSHTQGFLPRCCAQPEACEIGTALYLPVLGTFFFFFWENHFLWKYLPMSPASPHRWGRWGLCYLSCTIIEPSGKEGCNHCMIFFALAVGNTYVVAFLFQEMIMN